MQKDSFGSRNPKIPQFKLFSPDFGLNSFIFFHVNYFQIGSQICFLIFLLLLLLPLFHLNYFHIFVIFFLFDILVLWSRNCHLALANKTPHLSSRVIIILLSRPVCGIGVSAPNGVVFVSKSPLGRKLRYCARLLPRIYRYFEMNRSAQN